MGVLYQNIDSEVFASATRTATANANDQENEVGRGAVIVVDVTAVAATPSVVFKIQGKDPESGAYYDILTSAAVTGVSTNVYRVYPGLTAVANLTANDLLPRTWRVRAEHGDADSITYSVGALLVL